MGPDERASLGLSPPRAHAWVRGENEEPLAEVLFGRLDVARGIYAQRAGDPKIYALDPTLADALPISGAVFDANFVARAALQDAESESADEDPLSDLEMP